MMNRLENIPINTYMAKSFEVNKQDKWFGGKVVGYDKKKKWFGVEYEDGDAEEMSLTELKQGIANFQHEYTNKKQHVK